jgi:hypothetical protein
VSHAHIWNGLLCVVVCVSEIDTAAQSHTQHDILFFACKMNEIELFMTVGS